MPGQRRGAGARLGGRWAWAALLTAACSALGQVRCDGPRPRGPSPKDAYRPNDPVLTIPEAIGYLEAGKPTLALWTGSRLVWFDPARPPGSLRIVEPLFLNRAQHGPARGYSIRTTRSWLGHLGQVEQRSQGLLQITIRARLRDPQHILEDRMHRGSVHSREHNEGHPSFT